MKIVMYSDDPYWCTGFGTQIKNLAWRLKRIRPTWDIAVSHWGQPGVPIPTQHGFTLLPKMSNAHAGNVEFYIKQYKPDFFLTLYDIFVSGAFMPQFSKKNGYSDTRWISWFVFEVGSV